MMENPHAALLYMLRKFVRRLGMWSGFSTNASTWNIKTIPPLSRSLPPASKVVAPLVEDRGIPTLLADADTIDCLSKIAGPSFIKAFINQKRRLLGGRGIQTPFVPYRTVQQRVQEPAAFRFFESTLFAAWLTERKLKDGLWADFKADKGYLEAGFFVLPGGPEIVHRMAPKGGRRNRLVLQFDATYALTKRGFKVCCFVVALPDNTSKVVCGGVIETESKELFSWLFKAFERAFGVIPFLILTDQCSKIEAAVQLVFVKTGEQKEDFIARGLIWMTIHLLCIFHLWKNFTRKIAPLYRAKEHLAAYNKLKHVWWKLAKTSDVKFNFDATYKEFQDGVLAHITRYGGRFKDTTKDSARNWLRTTFKLKKRWAACFTWLHFTMGGNASQRVEGFNSGLKSAIQKKQRLKDLAQAMQHYAEERDFQRLHDKHTKITTGYWKQRQAECGAVMYPIMRDKLVSAYAIDCIHTQDMASSFYELDEAKMPRSAFKSGHMAVLLFGCHVTVKHKNRLYHGHVSQICWPDKDEGILFNVFYPGDGDSEDLDFDDFLIGLWSVCEGFLGQGAGEWCIKPHETIQHKIT